LNLRIALLVPFYNEAMSTTSRTCELLSTILKSNSITRLLVVDDGSDLDSYNNLQECVNQVLKGFSFEVVRLNANLGYGGAINFGLKKLISQDFDWVIIADSELSMHVDDITSMVDAIRQYPESLAVKSSRYLLPDGFDQLIGGRKIMSLLGRHIARILTFFKISDPTTGFRALNLNYLDPKKRSENGFASIAEEMRSLVSVSLKNLIPILEIPYTYQSRNSNDRKSSFGFSPGLFAKYLKYFIEAYFILLVHSLRLRRLDVIGIK